MNDLLLIHRVVLTHASYMIILLATTVLGSLIGARHAIVQSVAVFVGRFVIGLNQQLVMSLHLIGP